MSGVMTLFALAAAQGSVPPPPTSPLDRTIRAQGLEDLTDDQLARVRKLLIAMMRPAPSETLSVSANAYMTKEGFRQCSVQFVSIKYKDWIVVDSGYGPYATSDLPLLLNSFTMPAGRYYCRVEIMGGAREIIDQSGNTQRFLFANWTAVR